MFENDNINSKIRKEQIIEYVTRNQECDKEKVITHCIEKKVGTKVTIRKAIDELAKEGILKLNKKDFKSYRLTIPSGDLLLKISQDLEEIFVQFKDFVFLIKKISEGKDGINTNETFSKIYTIDQVSSLPIKLIDTIDDIFKFYFILILPKKIDDQKIIMKLISKYFENLNNMYLLVTKELNFVPSYDLVSIQNSVLYKSYMQSKMDSFFTKIYSLVEICRELNIEENLYKVLDLVWSKNADSAALLYRNELAPPSLLIIKQPNFKKPSKKLSKDNVVKISNVLDGIHECIESHFKGYEISEMAKMKLKEIENNYPKTMLRFTQNSIDI